MNQDKAFCTYLPLAQATVNFVHFIDSSINRKVSPEKRMEFEESVKELELNKIFNDSIAVFDDVEALNSSNVKVVFFLPEKYLNAAMFIIFSKLLVPYHLSQNFCSVNPDDFRRIQDVSCLLYELGRFSNMEGQAKIHQEPIIIGGSLCLDLLWA